MWVPLKQWICLQSSSRINARRWAWTDTCPLTQHFLVATLLIFWNATTLQGSTGVYIVADVRSWRLWYGYCTIMCMSVPPNLSVLAEVYQLLYGFGICLGIHQVHVLFWAFSWFLIPPCQLRGFCVQLLDLTFTGSVSGCVTALYRDSSADFAVVY